MRWFWRSTLDDSQQEMDTGSDSQESIFASKSTLGGTRGLKPPPCGLTGGAQGRSSLILGSFTFLNIPGFRFSTIFWRRPFDNCCPHLGRNGMPKASKNDSQNGPKLRLAQTWKIIDLACIYHVFERSPPQKQQHSREFSG